MVSFDRVMAVTDTAEYKDIRFVITSLWKRSADAEGNPMHKAQTRKKIEFCHQPVQVIPIEGITISSDWHRDKQVQERNWVPDPENRAILIQTYDNKCILQSKFPIFKDNESYANMFGENMVIKRVYNNDNEDQDQKQEAKVVTEPISACNIFCIGDILEISRDGIVVCKLQIASPRWPCYKIDKRCNIIKSGDNTQASVQKYCVDTSLGGIFCSVLIKGNICCGDIISIKERIHNDLTLGYVARLCYGGDVNKKTCLIKEFQGNEQEFQRLINCPELSIFEWKDRLLRWDKKQKQKQKQLSEENQTIKDNNSNSNARNQKSESHDATNKTEEKSCIIQ